MNKEPAMKSRLTCFVLLSLLSTAPLARADDAPPPSAPLKMDAALKQARPGGVALTVDAAKVSLPPSAVVPGDRVTAQEVGALYGQATQPFGSVLAIAPPTITVVYAPPETPNPYDGMPPGQVMKLLAQTFTPAQWKAFLSPAGVAYTDMTGDTQPPLFRAMFPGGHLSLIDTRTDSLESAKFKREFPGTALTAAHLRLTCLTSIALQMADDPNGYKFAANARPDGSPPLYFVTNTLARDVDHEYGATVRERVPNTPKPCQMAFDDPALKTPVPLANIRTVDDLITRIGVIVHREIYADPRFGSRLVTLVPSSAPQSAPAADLLQALAFCVGGTFRHIGPAYILTDDVVGLGTRHVLWKAFEDKAASMLPGNDNGDDMPAMPAPSSIPGVPYTVKDISDNSDPLAMTPKQKEMYWKKWVLAPSQSSSFSMDVTVPFAQLSPAQQEAAQTDQEANEKSHKQTTLGGTVMVQSEAEVEVLLPELTGRAIITQSYDGLLPYPALRPVEQQAQQKRMEAESPDMAPPNVPVPDFAQTLRGFSRRAARITVPQTAKEASEAFAALQSLGFNEAWVSVQPGPASGDDDLRARLTQATAEGKKRGITVFSDLSLLHWPKDVSPDLLDRNIQGQTTSSQRFGPPSVPTVSPFAAAAVTRLSVLVRILAGVPGIGGMVWEDTLALGYEANVPGENIGTDPSENPLGYAEAGRLAFVRLAHADPLDVWDNSYSDERAQVHVPDFDGDSGRESRLFTDWKKLRADTSQNFLRTLAAALPLSFIGTGTRLPLLLPPSNITFANSYGSWDNLTGPIPVVHFIAQTGPDGQPLMGVESIEKMSSALAYKKVQPYLPPAASVAAWKTGMAHSLMQTGKLGYRNVLLDLTSQPTLLEEKPPRPPIMGEHD